MCPDYFSCAHSSGAVPRLTAPRCPHSPTDTGYLCDWYGLCKDSTFLGGDITSADAEAPNPEVFGYWLNGAVPLSFQVDDEHLTGVIKKVVGYVLDNTQPDGIIGAILLIFAPLLAQLCSLLAHVCHRRGVRIGAPLIEQPQCRIIHGNKTCTGGPTSNLPPVACDVFKPIWNHLNISFI